MNIDQLSADQLSADQLSADQLSADQLSADQIQQPTTNEVVGSYVKSVSRRKDGRRKDKPRCKPSINVYKKSSYPKYEIGYRIIKPDGKVWVYSCAFEPLKKGAGFASNNLIKKPSLECANCIVHCDLKSGDFSFIEYNKKDAINALIVGYKDRRSNLCATTMGCLYLQGRISEEELRIADRACVIINLARRQAGTPAEYPKAATIGEPTRYFNAYQLKDSVYMQQLSFEIARAVALHGVDASNEFHRVIFSGYDLNFKILDKAYNLNKIKNILLDIKEIIK